MTRSAKSVTAARPKQLTLAEKLANHMPPGLVVEAKADGKILVALDAAASPDRFRSVGGCESEFANILVLNQVLNTLPQTSDLAEAAIRATGAVEMVRAFAPKDAVEAMIATQAVALHLMTMEAARRAQMPSQPAEASARLRRDTANLARAMTDICEALDRRRGKGPQVVRVERVVVQDGGQAVVGNVNAGSGKAVGRAAEPLVLAAPERAGVRDGEG